jgi:threonine dehydrogenase-like Zn-dependent dehydrogenase
MTESRHWRYRYHLESESFIKEEEQPLSSPVKNQILIKPLMVGICGSDLSKIAHKVKNPSLGHEWVGVIEAIGEDVLSFTPGEVVTSVANISCGECHHCQNRKADQCKKRQLLGSKSSVLSTQVMIHDHDLLKVPQNLDHASITLLEVAYIGDCAFYQAKSLGLKHGDRVVIFGAGPIGLMTALSLKERGYESHLIELEPARIQAAKEFGLSCSAFALEIIERRFFSRCDAVIDCTGDSTGNGALKYLPIFAKMGGIVVVVGKYHQASLGESDFGSKAIKLSWVANHRKENFEKSILFWQDRIVKYSREMTTNYDLNDINQGFKAAHERKILKAILASYD